MQDEMTLDLKDFLNILRKRMSLIIIITLVTTLAAGIISFFIIKPTYEAQTSIIIGKAVDNQNQKVDYSDVMMYQQLVKTYSEIAQSRRVADKTLEKLNNGMTVQQLQKSITVTPEQNTQILIVKTQGKDAKESARIVNTLSETFIEEARVIYPTGVIQIMDNAQVPDKAAKPNKKLNVAIAFFLGLMGSVGLSFLFEYMDSTLKTEEDIEKYLELPVIGIIPKKIEA